MSDKIERIIDALRKKILESAIRGELVPQNPEDEPASKLLERIAEERDRLIKEKKIKKPKSSSRIFRRDGHFYESINGGKPTCIDEEIPFEIPDSWEWCRLAALSYVVSGTSYNKTDVDNEGIRILRGDNIQDGELRLHSSDVYLPLQYKDEDKNIAKGDIILVGSTGSELVIGKAAFISKVLENTQIGAFLRIVRPYCKEYAQYVAVIFKTTFYREYIRKKASGTNINNIKSGHLENFLIPVPPVKEQLRIVNSIAEKEQHFLVIQSSRIRYKHILSGTPTSLRQQLIQAAIQGQLVPQNPNDEPANKMLESIAEERASKLGKKAAKSMSRIERRGSKTYELFPNGTKKDISDDIPFEIPDSWEWSTLGIVSINRDSERIPLSKAQRQGHSKIYDYYGASGVIDKVERYLYDSRLLLIGEDGANLLSRSTDIAFIAEGKYWVNNHAHVLDSHKGISLDYIKHYVNGISLVKYVTGSAQPKLTQDNLNAIIIPVPPAAEQLRIVEKIESILSTLAL